MRTPSALELTSAVLLERPYLLDAEKAREFLEVQRWPTGPVCPHCDRKESATRLNQNEGGQTHGRNGLLQCNACRKQFTVTVGTLFEDTRVPLHKWLLAIYLVSTTRTRPNIKQLCRAIEVTYKTAWSMRHRIQAAILRDPVLRKAPRDLPELEGLVRRLMDAAHRRRADLLDEAGVLYELNSKKKSSSV